MLFCGDTAVVMLAWEDPREIGFQGGGQKAHLMVERLCCVLWLEHIESVSLMEVHRLVTNIFIVTSINVIVIICIVSHDICIQ
jgi:hypothetical protein